MNIHFAVLLTIKELILEKWLWFVGLALTFLILMVTFSIGEHYGYVPKEILCKKALETNEVLTKQVESLETRSLEDVVKRERACVKVQTDLCFKKVQEFKDSYKKLRCKICKGEDQ